MPGDPLKKVQSGQKLTIPAAAYNAFVDAANAHRSNQRASGGQASQQYPYPSDVVLVQNTTTEDLDIFDIMPLNGPINKDMTVDRSLAHLKQPVFKSALPYRESWMGFCVLLEPIKVGKCGMACVSGVCPAYVTFVEGEWFGYAGVASYLVNPAPTKLELINQNTGPAAIVWTTRTVVNGVYPAGKFMCLIKFMVNNGFHLFRKYKLFDTPGTYQWTAPAGVNKVRITVLGGGGGGGGSSTTTTTLSTTFTDSGGHTVTIPSTLRPGGGGGGASGTLTTRTISYLLYMPTAIFDIVVGAGGTAGPLETNGGLGGASSAIFSNSSWDLATVRANGGSGGSGINPGAVNRPGLGGTSLSVNYADNYVTHGANGAIRAEESVFYPGANGEAGMPGASGVSFNQYTAAGGRGGKPVCLLSTGHYPSSTSQTPLLDRGNGGKGGDTGYAGSAGQPGYVLIEY